MLYNLIQTLKNARARVRDIYISYNIVFTVNVHKLFLDVFFFFYLFIFCFPKCFSRLYEYIKLNIIIFVTYSILTKEFFFSKNCDV